MTESVLDIMSGGTKAPGAFDKYSQIGTTVSGRIDSVEVWDVRKFGTTEVQTWDDGRPQKQLRIVFQADPGTWTPQGEDDTGLRAHYVKAWNPHLKSLRDAVAATGEQEPKPGGWISIRYDHDQPSKSGFDTKIYVYQYQAPATEVAGIMADQQPQAQPQQFQAQQTPVAPVANVHTAQGQVNPQTGEIVGQAAPVAPVPPQQAPQPVQAQPQPWEQAQQAQVQQQPVQQAPAQDPWTGQPATAQQAQAAVGAGLTAAQPGPAAGTGMDSNIMKLIQAGLPDDVIVQTLGAQGVTAEQVAQVRATFG